MKGSLTAWGELFCFCPAARCCSLIGPPVTIRNMVEGGASHTADRGTTSVLYGAHAGMRRGWGGGGGLGTSSPRQGQDRTGAAGWGGGRLVSTLLLESKQTAADETVCWFADQYKIHQQQFWESLLSFALFSLGSHRTTILRCAIKQTWESNWCVNQE